jgi:hypothetical protein
MKRNLKVFGLALVTMLAIGAVTASAASAAIHHFNSEAAETILDAKAMGKQILKFTATDTKEIVCEEVSLVPANSKIVGKTVTEVTVEPKYEKCSVWEIKNPTTGGGETVKELASAKIETNGCHYLLTGETTTTAATTGEFATVHLTGCKDATKGITLKVSALNTECIHISDPDP